MSEVEIEVVPAKRILSHEELEAMRQVVNDTIAAYLAKPGQQVCFEKMLHTAIDMMALQMHQSGRFSREEIQDMVLQALEHVKNVKAKHGSAWGRGFICLSAITSFVSAAMGLAPLTGTSLFATATLETMGKAVQPVSSVGSGLGSVGGIFDSKVAGERYEAQAAHERHKAVQDDRTNSERQFDSRKRELVRAGQDTDAESHKAFQSAG